MQQHPVFDKLNGEKFSFGPFLANQRWRTSEDSRTSCIVIDILFFLQWLPSNLIYVEYNYISVQAVFMFWALVEWSGIWGVLSNKGT